MNSVGSFRAFRGDWADDRLAGSRWIHHPHRRCERCATPGQAEL